MILSIDTSGSSCGVALWQDGLIGFRESKKALRHNEMLLDQIHELFGDCEIEHSKLTGVAVSAGPGSFTGLRVGMATAKGLCWSWKKPFITIPTLEGLAEAVHPSAKRILALMPARATEVYWAAFEHDTVQWKRQTDDQVSDIFQLSELIQDDVFLFGEGYTKHKAEIDRIFAGRIITLKDGEETEALAISTARLAAKRYNQKRFDDLMETEPLYCYAFPRKGN